MAGMRAPVSSILSSAALAVLTLSVFWLERDAGPSGVVKMFNEYARMNQWEKVSSVSLEYQDYEAAIRMKDSFELAQAIYQKNGEFNVIDTKVKGPEALVSGVYQLGPRRLVTYWVVDRTPAGWNMNFYDSSQFANEMWLRGLMQR